MKTFPKLKFRSIIIIIYIQYNTYRHDLHKDSTNVAASTFAQFSHTITTTLFTWAYSRPGTSISSLLRDGEIFKLCYHNATLVDRCAISFPQHLDRAHQLQNQEVTHRRCLYHGP